MLKNTLISVSSEEENRGSIEFQVFRFTTKIRRLTSHLELHKKDYLSQRGLRKILGKRQQLLAYLAKKKNYYIFDSKKRNEFGYNADLERFKPYRIDQKGGIAYRTRPSVCKK